MLQAKIEEGRAEFALNAVKAIKGDGNIGDKNKKEYKSYCRKFAGLVLTNGLAAAVAFLIAKGGSYNFLYKDIEKWLISQEFYTKPTTLEEYVCSLDSDSYREATGEVIALYRWLSRFATGLIEGESEG